MRPKMLHLMTVFLLGCLFVGAQAFRLDASPKVLHLDDGESALLAYQGIERVAVGNPDVLDARPLNSREILVTAKEAGNSTLVVWDRSGRHFLSFLVHPSTRARLWEIEKLLAEEGVKVSLTETATVLEGTVENPAARARALAIADAFGAKVVDLLQVARADQIRLEASVLELDRSAGEKLGLQSLERLTNGSVTGFIDLATDFNHIAIRTLNGISGTQDFSMVLNALEEKNLGRVLSKPYLTTLSGEKAHLNVGGEIPVPVGLDSGEIKIDWKPYGVILSITPELDGKENIWLTLEAEVSEIDWDNRIVTSGIEIPALKTRKISNRVRLKPGEPLIVGGLIDNKQTELKTRVPILGDLPIIGELFRSRRFENSETELVITIVPEIVDSEGRTNEPKDVPHFSETQPLGESTISGSMTASEGTLRTSPPPAVSPAGTPSVSAQVAQPGTEGKWAVQIGAFPDMDSARQRSQKLRNQGYNAAISEATVDGKRFYRVRVPAGNDRSAAIKLSRELKGKGYKTFIASSEEVQ